MSLESSFRVFYSYAREDEKLRETLERHLSLLKWEYQITSWYALEVGPGKEWDQEINTHLSTALIILLLMSANYMASEHCYCEELKRAMQRHEAGEARVIPVILQPVDWEGAPFGKLKALPTGAKPVTTWQNRHKAYLDIAKGIRRAVEELTKKGKCICSD